MTRFLQEGLCGIVLYLIGFYVLFYYLQYYANPQSRNYKPIVYTSGVLVLVYLVVFVVRNLMKIERFLQKEGFIGNGGGVNAFGNNGMFEKTKCRCRCKLAGKPCTGLCKCNGFEQPKFTVKYFYLPNCPHCVKFDPTWDELMKHIMCEHPCTVKFEKMDGSQPEYKEQTNVYNVYAFPTLICTINEDGNERVVKYEGQRTAASIYAWLKEHVLHPYIPNNKLFPPLPPS